MKFIVPGALEAILINNDWLHIFQNLNELDNQDWNTQLINFIRMKQKPLEIKPTQITEFKIFDEKNFDILKELQSIGKIILNILIFETFSLKKVKDQSENLLVLAKI